MKIENRSRKRSHKLDGIGVRFGLPPRRLQAVKTRVRFFKKIQDWILKSERIRKWTLRFFTKQINPRSFGSWCVKGTEESTSRVDSPLPLRHHDSRYLGLICLVNKRTLGCRSRKQKRKNQPIARPGVEHCHWLILSLLLTTPTMQFSLNRKRRRHKQDHCSASDSVGLIFTRSYRCTLLITTPTTTQSLVKTSL